MKNIVILQNRPSLTSAEVAKGIDFAKIKNSSVTAKSLASKSIFVKTNLFKLIIIGIISSSIVLIAYYKTNTPTQIKKDNVTDTLKSSAATIEDQRTDSLPLQSVEGAYTTTKSPTSLPSVNINPAQLINTVTTIPQATSINTTINAITKTDTVSDHRTIPVKSFKATPNVKCVIWDTNNFCEYPKDTYFPSPINCYSCEFHYLSCKDVINKNVKAIWVTVNNRRVKFKLTSGLENVTLQRSSDNSIASPIGIALGNKSSDGKGILFLNTDFKTGGFSGQFKQQLDLFILFEDPKVGDKLFIDGFIQAEIK